MKILLLSVLIVFTQSAWTKPIIGGSVDVNNIGNGIIAIIIEFDEGKQTALCTGSKVGQDAILTAAHCVHGRKFSHIGIMYDVHNNVESIDWVKVTNTFISNGHKKNQNPQNSILHEDISVLRIKPSKKFNRIPTLRMDFTHVDVGVDHSIWGYGCSTPMVGDYTSDFKRRLGSSEILGPEDVKDLGGRFPTVLYDRIETIIASQIILAGHRWNEKYTGACEGDSGGPLLKDGKIVGVNSTGVFNDINDQGLSESGIYYVQLYSRLSRLESWLLAVIK